jgi:MFS family permease
LGALIGFVVASAVCGFAPTVGVLIAARIVQGATAALLIPQVLATFHHTLQHQRKARALALYGATSGIAAVVGQLVGGLLVSADIAGTSWRPIFLVNVPIGLVVLLVAARIVPKTRSNHPVGIDLPGTVLFAATLTALLVPLTEGHSLGWPWWTWALIAIAVVLCAVTFVVEQRAEQRGEIPLLPPSLLRLPSMSRGLAMVFAFSIGFGAFMFVFALTVQDGLHADALHGGLAILPMAVLFFLGSVFAPRLIGRFGRAALSVGAVIQLAGLASLLVVFVQGWPHVSLWAMAVPLALAGAGQSMLFAGLFRSVLADVPTHLGGVGSGVLITLQQSGLALGVATLGTLYLSQAAHNTAHAFATVEYTQMGIIAVLAIGAAALPRFTKAAVGTPPLEG